MNLLFKLGAYTATDVARIAELGKLTPDQYKEITGKNYEASTVDQLEGTQ
ncbi:XkdX family protein [Bacillus mobilis]|nr:XkdX family protein [Bacillus mobilis]